LIFDWLDMGTRFIINLVFIASLILMIRKQAILKVLSFTFLIISLVIYFLCYTLKNLDLNLGMALGLFAIFGIIRFRTEPLHNDQMTYLFVTIGMTVINSLSEGFLNTVELLVVNIIVLVAIFIGEKFLKKPPSTKSQNRTPSVADQKLQLMIPYDMENLEENVAREVELQEQKLGCVIKYHKVAKVDKVLNQITVHLFY
jgi:prepilin signal peptidase PulO-like enzyme (type II secretory pathway)